MTSKEWRAGASDSQEGQSCKKQSEEDFFHASFDKLVGNANPIIKFRSQSLKGASAPHFLTSLVMGRQPSLWGKNVGKQLNHLRRYYKYRHALGIFEWGSNGTFLTPTAKPPRTWRYQDSIKFHPVD